MMKVTLLTSAVVIALILPFTNSQRVLCQSMAPLEAKTIECMDEKVGGVLTKCKDQALQEKLSWRQFIVKDCRKEVNVDTVVKVKNCIQSGLTQSQSDVQVKKECQNKIYQLYIKPMMEGKKIEIPE